MATTTIQNKVLSALTEGKALTSADIKNRYKAGNPQAVIQALRFAGYPVFLNTRKNSRGKRKQAKSMGKAQEEQQRQAKTSKIHEGASIPKNKWKTIYISGGRKDKISKGDIAGLFIKKGNIDGSELGVIELKNDCAFVAVATAKATALCNKLNNQRLKKKKVRISTIQDEIKKLDH